MPLDPAFPRDRLAFMAADAEIPFLVTQQGLMHELPEHQAQVVCADALDFAQPAVPNRSAVSASGLAYVLYTSGSTGRPKGVQISHRALVNFLYSMRREPGLRAEDVFSGDYDVVLRYRRPGAFPSLDYRRQGCDRASRHYCRWSPSQPS